MLSRGTIKAHERELKRRLREIGEQANFHGDLYADCLELLEKEEPKPTMLQATPTLRICCRCPNCGRVLKVIDRPRGNKTILDKLDQYCRHCGQRLA